MIIHVPQLVVRVADKERSIRMACIPPCYDAVRRIQRDLGNMAVRILDFEVVWIIVKHGYPSSSFGARPYCDLAEKGEHQEQ